MIHSSVKSFGLLLCFCFFTALSGLVVAATPAESGAEMVQAVQVDINRADAATLASGLAGVGLAKAQAIVAWREQNGPFTTIESLLRVKGIGESILEQNRSRIAL